MIRENVFEKNFRCIPLNKLIKLLEVVAAIDSKVVVSATSMGNLVVMSNTENLEQIASIDVAEEKLNLVSGD